ncbi:MAG: Acylphosphatase [Methanosaeta sp. PtaB.Bin039]|nr:MAG: Acylphosphatase [Methanosaeta sp. PtaB.Bin039]HOT07231.1 acylphosphatase [Methanotrichaceae archaeon]HQF17259.1 acylphosphatase [Methanotrichaceae archaeon]HQI91832.1 acylphosphatase [Methanotrichaceae archaeon]HQJ29162.1 acylphosphatase [Methanotrichaceae archaeon]
MSGTICVRVRVSGRVQGVGFRRFTEANAQDKDVKGWVRNLPGGGVEAVLEGERKKVGELLSLMKEGPAGAMVSGIELAELEIRGFSEFKVIY